MPFLIDKRINPTALHNLERLDTVIPFMTDGITYPAISGHPDIFFCVSGDLLIASEAVPDNIIRQLDDAGVDILISKNRPGMQYPSSAIFNAVVTDSFLIHCTDITDISIKENTTGKTQINVSQGYTRCNLLVPDERLWITSDAGIFKILNEKGLNVLSVDPKQVSLQGFSHGFFGGCCGVFKNRILVNGSLKNLKEGKAIRHDLEKYEYQVIELHQGMLEDVGSIMVIPSLGSYPADC